MNLVQAWKDPDYRDRLSSTELIGMEHPAGTVELRDDDLDGVAAGTGWACALVTAGVGVSVAYCSPNGTFCGSCRFGTNGCC